MSYLRPQDQIQNGVVDRSPTENAVYDALALKADTNLQNLSLSGSNGQVLTLVSGVPAWAALPASGVTSVTASAPLASSGGTTPNISISQASALSDGYLSSVDWSTFNGKQNALTFGNLTEATSSVLTISGGSGSVIGTGTSIQVKQASAGQSGFLSSTDWSTFNGKQPAGNYITALTGEVTATGPGSAAATIAGQSGNADKMLATNGTTVSFQYAGLGSGGFGTNNVILGRSKPTNLTGTNTIIIGTNTANVSTASNDAVYIGYNAGLANVSATQHTIVGSGALQAYAQTVNAGGVVALGYQAFTALTTANNNVGSGEYPPIAIGNQAALTTTSGTGAVAIGYRALNRTTITQSTAVGSLASGGIESVSVGWECLRDTTGARNIGIGRSGMSTLSSGTDNVGIGYAAGFFGGFFGYSGAQLTTGSGNLLLGAYSATSTSSTTYGISIGYNAVSASNECAIGGYNTNGVTQGRVDTVLLGRGGASIPAAGAAAVKVMTQRATGTNIDVSAGTLTLAGSQSTGTAAGGAVFIATAPTGASGSGLNAHVNRLQVSAAGDVSVLTGQLSVDTVGKGLTIKAGSNAKIGVATFSGVSSVTVSTTAVTANSIILVTTQSGGYAPMCVNNIVAGTSFDIIHNNTFTGTVGWMIVERS